ncbi:hypothetical protein [Geomonas sp.]|uniref:hypothetical protein n=1 Tax=Geomonas sp. TaxID=2651584 RepID=UPI002B494713|nr:hypothetical protein [Geomonas sp.]HJV36394.1 hypothetical protein [Geomonas sp.]
MWEYEGEMGEYESEMGEYEGEAGEYEGEGEYENMEFGNEFEFGESEGEVPLSESMEMELAAELLSVSNEAELEQFLGGLIKKVGGFVKGPIGRALGGVLKTVAKKALPIVGGAIGSWVAPGVGTAIGSKLGSMASNLFEMELEGLSNEDREFEVARRVVRLASSAARHAARAPQHIPPQQVARKAVLAAARRHAPGLAAKMMRPQQRPAAPMAGRPGYGRPWPGTPQYGRRQSQGAQPPPGMRPPQGAVPSQRPQPGWGPGPRYSQYWWRPNGGQQAPQQGWTDGWGGEPQGMWGDNGYDQQGQQSQQSGRWVRRGRNIIILGA